MLDRSQFYKLNFKLSHYPANRLLAPIQDLSILVARMSIKAIGIFNLGEEKAEATIKWLQIGLAHDQRVRDLWKQKNLGTFNRQFETLVPRHGVVLVKVSPRKDPSDTLTAKAGLAK